MNNILNTIKNNKLLKGLATMICISIIMVLMYMISLKLIPSILLSLVFIMVPGNFDTFLFGFKLLLLFSVIIVMLLVFIMYLYDIKDEQEE